MHYHAANGMPPLALSERERERMEEKRDRLAEKRQQMAAAAATEPTAEEEADDTKEAKKTLRIEVHATATHHGVQQHQQLEPVVAHSQQHDISHNQAVRKGLIGFFERS